MINQPRIYKLVVFLIMLLASTQIVLADAAPPQQPPITSITSGDFETNVQMVSEEVIVFITESDIPEDERRHLATDHIQGRVEATFWMQNQGDETEAFDVWFPLGEPDGYFDVSTIENFTAAVDGVPAEIGEEIIPGEFDEMVPWATWPAVFPPGETVVITVTYDLRPTGYMPYGEFYYILETGAGWWGEIGEGTVTVRLPYEVNEYNVPIYSNAEAIDDFAIDGTDMIWTFTDLEPDRQDNIRVKVLIPALWQDILAAEEAVAENPDSPEHYLTLARLQDTGLEFKYGLVCCEALAEMAATNYQNALKLAPDSLDIQTVYLDFLLNVWFPYMVETYSEDIPVMIESVLTLAPEDENILDLVETATRMYQEAQRVNAEYEIIQDGYTALQTALANAVEANPDNQRLSALYDTLKQTPAG